MRLIGAEEVAALGFTAAADALEAALRSGLDPEADPPRGRVPVEGGELLVMPSTAGGAPAVKLVTVGGDPLVQGVCVVFDPGTLAPAAILDGPALTNLRTAAVSQLAMRHLAAEDARTLVVFGRGPQARAHAAAFAEVRDLEAPVVFGRDAAADEVARAVEAADVVCCATTAREPLFDGALVHDDAVVVAVGAHEPDARETDDALTRRATVVVESRASALREAGDVIAAGLGAEDLVTLAELVTGSASVPDGRPRFFKSTGMSWEDAVVAGAVVA